MFSCNNIIATVKLYIVIKYVDAMNFKSADKKHSLEWWSISDLQVYYVRSIICRRGQELVAYIEAMLQVSPLVHVIV